MQILIVDDHPAIHAVVKQSILEVDPFIQIASCFTVNEAVQFIEDHHPDFVISDLELFQGCTSVIMDSCLSYSMPCMIYSSHVNKIALNEIENQCVKCYVSKKSDLHCLRLGIQALLENKHYFCPVVQLVKESKVSFKETEWLDLKKGQKKVIHLLAKGFKRQEVAEMLNVKLNTVNNHIARAREFNDCDNLEDLLRRYRFWDYS